MCFLEHLGFRRSIVILSKASVVTEMTNLLLNRLTEDSEKLEKLLAVI